MLVAFSVAPSGDPANGQAPGDASVHDAVAAAVRIVRESGLPNRTSSMFTEVEGDWDEVMDVVKRATEAVGAFGSRVSLVLKADIRPGYAGELTGKVERLEEALGTQAAGQVLPRLAEQLATLHRQRREIGTQVEAMVDAHPLCQVLTSMPGIGFRTAAVILVEVCGKDFATAGHLAAYAGLAPVTRRSGTSIRGEQQSRRGNKRLKRILYLSAFSALKDPPSRAYYDRKRSERKSHTQALVALARRRCDVLFAMLRDGATYDAEHAQVA